MRGAGESVFPPSTRNKLRIRRACVALLLFAAGAVSGAQADSDLAMRWMQSGDCSKAGEAINAGLARNEAKAWLLAGYLYAATGCVEPDPARAARYYQKAVELGDQDARAFLGLMYGLGNGIPQDYRAAYRWFSYGRPLVDPTDAIRETAAGYASTVTQLARSKVTYPRFVHDEGTVFVTLHSAGRSVTFSRDSDAGTPHRPIAHPTPFTQAIETAYEDAFREAPEPVGLPTKDLLFEVPWTFQFR